MEPQELEGEPAETPTEDDWDPPVDLVGIIERFNAMHRIVYRVVRSEIGAGSQHMRGERMSERVRREVCVNGGLAQPVLVDSGTVDAFEASCTFPPKDTYRGYYITYPECAAWSAAVPFGAT